MAIADAEAPAAGTAGTTNAAYRAPAPPDDAPGARIRTAGASTSADSSSSSSSSSTATVAVADAPTSRPQPATPLRFMTWNLRYDSLPDSITVAQTLESLPSAVPSDGQVRFYADYAEEPWSTRRIGIAREVLFSSPDILGVQEALVRQVHDLADPALLGAEYDWIGVGRDDGKEAGEFEAIFYKKSVVALHNWTTFWLSPTPFVPSKYPGAGSVRTATLAHFSAAASSAAERAHFTLVCTHWDDQSDAQRRLGASLIRYRGAYEAATTARPVFVLGDFNSPASGADSGGYDIMTGALPPEPIPADFARRYAPPGNASFVFRDLAAATPPRARSGEWATFTGFSPLADTADFSRIDFAMGGANGGWTAVRHRVGENWWDAGYHLSDHRPVWVDIDLE